MTTTIETTPSKTWIPRRTGSTESPGFSFKNLVSRRKRNESSTSIGDEAASPPPLPPKDGGRTRRSFSPTLFAPKLAKQISPQSDGDTSMAHVNFSAITISDLPPAPPPPFVYPTQSLIPITPFRRPEGPPRVISPAEKARARLEAEREREFEARAAMLEEEERQMRLKADKEEILRRSKEEEMRRKAKMERDLRLAAVKRSERERAEREAESARAQELEERRKVDRERRLLESQKWQAWREEQDRRRESLALKKDDEKRQTLEEKQAFRKELYDKLKAESTRGVLLSGWVSMQTPESLTWKRRYFILNENALQLYKSQADLSQPIDVMQLVDIRDVRDVGDVSEEEPEYIPFPHSFVVEEAEGCRWSMFTDDQQTKDTLIAVLVHAAGLIGSKVSYTTSSFFSRIPRRLAGN